MAFVSAFTPALRAAPASAKTTLCPSMAFSADLSAYEKMSTAPVSKDAAAAPKHDVAPPIGDVRLSTKESVYARMASTGPAGNAALQPRVSSAPSAGWTAFAASQAAKNAPTVTTYFRKRGEDSFADAMAVMREYATAQGKVKAPGGDPGRIASSVMADRYMAENCVTPQYKALANPSGVYSMGCTEGATSGQAEQSRELANLAAFRQKQRSTSQKYFDFCETRKMAINMSHGCSYDEGLAARYPKAAAAVVRGYSEAKQLCVRYNTAINYVQECGSDTAIASAYMSNSVDMQYKKRAVAGGIYTGTCADGNTSGLAEFKRVQAMSARYRAGMQSAGFKAQAKYDARKFAITMFRESCDYEEVIFNKYPAVSASMRPLTARY